MFRLLVSMLRGVLPGPIDVLAAIGDGRSYGRKSRFIVRELPGILECGLWPALEERPRTETRALIGDLGNDLVYGAEVGEIAAWIERILERLQERGAICSLVHLPLENIDRISNFRFKLARKVFYPGRKMELDELRRRARELDARMVELARARGVALVPKRGDWYGLDPIHVLRRNREEALATWLSPLADHRADGSPELSHADRSAMRGLRPQRRRFLGRLQVRDQPCARLLDGTTISVY
jgi:hypothetical protein